MQVSTAPTSTSRFVYCSTDKKNYVIDDPVTQTRVGCFGSDEKYEFKMKDGTKNTLQMALSRLNGETRSYLLARPKSDGGFIQPGYHFRG